MKRLNGSTRAIMRRPLTQKQWRLIDDAPPSQRLGALWRTLKYGHPFPEHRRFWL